METIYLEIREAEGGEDAKLLVKEMFDIYQKSCYRNNFISRTTNWRDGFISIEIQGNQVKKFFQNEIGGHRWQRIPPTERGGRVHTSTVTVALIENYTAAEVQVLVSKGYIVHRFWGKDIHNNIDMVEQEILTILLYWLFEFFWLYL